MEATVTAALVAYGLPLVAAIAFVSALCVPTGLPPIVVLLLAGALCLRTPTDLVAASGALAVAETAGALTLFALARAGSPRILARLPNGVAADAAARLATARLRLRGRDALAVAALRLVPGVRHLVAVGAGTLGVGRRPFVVGALASSWIWMAMFLAIGFRFRHEVAVLTFRTAGITGWLQAALPIALALAAVTLLARWRLPARRPGR